MKSVQFAWVVGAVSALGLGMAAEACSSSTTTSTSSSSTSSSSTSSSSTTTSSSSSSTTVGEADSGIKCYSVATKVYPEDAAGGHQYCPFSAADGGKSIYCAAGEQCCVPPEGDGVSKCVPVADTCPVKNSVDWVCSGTPDCKGTPNTICCGQGTLNAQSAQMGCAKPDGGGSYKFAVDGAAALPASTYVEGFYGSACQTSCTDFTDSGKPAFQICSQTSECPAGETCTPIEIKGNTVGFCSGTATGGSSSSSSTTTSSSSSSSSTGSSSSAASSSGH